MSVLDRYAAMPQWPKWRRENLHRFADANGTPAETLCLMAFSDRYERGEFNPPAPQLPKPKPAKPVDPKPKLTKEQRAALLDGLDKAYGTFGRLVWRVMFGDKSPETVAELKAAQTALGKVSTRGLRTVELILPIVAGFVTTLAMRVAERINEVVVQINARNATDRERVAALETRFADLELRDDTATLGERIAALESHVSESELSEASASGRIATLEKRLSDLEFRDNASELGERIATLEGHLSATGADNFGERLAVLEKQIVDLDFRDDAGNLGERVAVLENSSFAESLDTLRADFDELKAGTISMRWKGVWQKDASYVKGNTVTYRGSLWHANQPSSGVVPGSNSYSWQLCVKSGRDARGTDRRGER